MQGAYNTDTLELSELSTYNPIQNVSQFSRKQYHNGRPWGIDLAIEELQISV